MEGFVLKKGFATRFNRRWFVLDQQYLTYYETFDQERDEPINLRGVLQLRNAEVAPESFKNRPNALRIRTQEKRTVILDCEDSNYKETWLKALKEATTKHQQLTRAQQYEQSLRVLDLPTDREATERDITVAYKKASLKLHPDKGGNVDEFNKLNLAYTQAKEYLEHITFRSTAKIVEYEALIEKGGAGVGVGLIVTEDQVNNEIVVTRVSEKCMIRGLSAEADGQILPDDILIGINNDETIGWNLTRLKARLNNFRAPVGVVLRISLRRYVPHDEAADDASARSRTQRQAAENIPSEAQLGADNLGTPLPILLINDELDGEADEDEGEDVKDEWSVERKVFRKEIKRLRRSLTQVEGASIISRVSDDSSVVPSVAEIELRRELELLRNRCREYAAETTDLHARLQFQQEQIDRLVDENAHQSAELVQLRASVNRTSTDHSSATQELEELRRNYRRVISDLHDAEEKVRELDRQLIAESQFREAVKATFAEHDQAPGQAAQEVMAQVAMLQRERDAAIRERQLYRQLLYKQLHKPNSNNSKQDTVTQDKQSPAARLQAMIDKYAAALNFE